MRESKTASAEVSTQLSPAIAPAKKIAPPKDLSTEKVELGESKIQIKTESKSLVKSAETEAKQPQVTKSNPQPHLSTPVKVVQPAAIPELETKSAPELIALADDKVKQQELAAAIDLYHRALKIEPNAWKTHRKLGRVYRQHGQLDLSLTYLQQSAAIQPQVGEIHSDIGLTLAQLGKWSEAIAAYTKGLEINPKQPWTYYKLAAVQEKQHDFASAAESLQQAIQYEQNNSLFYRNLAQVQQLRGNLDESIAAYRQAIIINPDLELTIYRNLGQAVKHNAIVKPRLGLQSLATRLKTKVGKIAYLGGSPTVQPDGYAPRLQSLLDSYFGQPQTMIKAANGGITSSAAVFTMERDLIPYQPDLCLIEYSSTDMGKGYDVTRALEGMVKKLMQTGCQICFLYMYKQGCDFSGNDPVLIEYEKVAEFYGIPSINVGKHLAKSDRQGKLKISELLQGQDKTSPLGSQTVAEFIFAGLQEIFATSSPSKVDSFNHHHHQERYLDRRNYAEGKIVEI
ncbi:MAG: tetratricopeptide repeat protein, partial [Cyanobacteria bacterium J06600_6]